MLEVELRTLREFEQRLAGDHEDWEVILGLKQRGAEALVSCDDNMLAVAQVVAVIEQTRFTVVTCREAGDDPVVASGLLLTYLPAIGRRHHPDKPQVWRLRATEKRPEKIGDLKASIEERSGVRVDDYRLSREALQEPLLP